MALCFRATSNEFLRSLSHWSSLKIGAGGTSVELIGQLQETVAAAEDMAAQAERAADAAETSWQQVANLTSQLQARNVLSAAVLQRTRVSLQPELRVDLPRLRDARAAANRIHAR